MSAMGAVVTQRLNSERGEPGLLTFIFLTVGCLALTAFLWAWQSYSHTLGRMQDGVKNTSAAVALNTVPWIDPATGVQSQWIDMARAQSTATEAWGLSRLLVEDPLIKQPVLNLDQSPVVITECVDLGPAPGLCGQVRVQVSEQFQGSLFAPVGVGRPTITREGFAKIRVNQ